VGALSLHLLPLFVAVLLVDFFDTIGTSTAIARKRKLTDATVDPTAAAPAQQSTRSPPPSGACSGQLGDSYIESAAGVVKARAPGCTRWWRLCSRWRSFATPIARDSSQRRRRRPP